MVNDVYMEYIVKRTKGTKGKAWSSRNNSFSGYFDLCDDNPYFRRGFSAYANWFFAVCL